MAAILNSVILNSTILHKTLTQTNSIWLKLIHFDSTWRWQPSWILPYWIQPFCTKKLHLFILTQLDDGSNLEFCHGGFRYFYLGIRHLVIFSQIHTKHSHSTLMLIQTNSIWLKLIHSHLTWWWQPSWILPCWIKTLPSWIQTPCYPLSDSLKNTLTPLWCWFKLIQSDSSSFILT